MIRSGQLNSVIRLERGSASVNASGKREVAWSVLGTLRAQVIRHPVEEVPKDRGTGTVTRRPVSFRTWFRDDVRIEDRIVFGGFAYLVKAITEIGRRNGLEIRTELDGAV